jgi:hypothetical protein
VDSRVVVWKRENLLSSTQRIRGSGKLSEVRITLRVITQGTVLYYLLFLTYVNDIWRNTESTLRFSADDCVIYRKIQIKKTWKYFGNLCTGWGCGRIKMR